MAQRPSYTKVTGNTYTAANWREIAEKCNQPGKTVSFNETVPYDDEYIMSTPHTQSGELNFIKGSAPTFGDGRGNGVLYLITSDGNDWNFTTDFGNFSGDLTLTSGAVTPTNGTTYRLVSVWNGTTFEVAINEVSINVAIPPTLTSATIENASDDVLDLVFNEAVTITTAGWNIDTDGAALSISSVLSGSGTTTPKFQLSRSVLSTETLNVDYNSATGATVSTSTAVELVTFTDTAVTNNVAGVWTPADLEPNLTLWLDATQGVTETGLGVSLWEDQSSNSHDFTQGTDADRPSLNTDEIVFDGTEWLERIGSKSEAAFKDLHDGTLATYEVAIKVKIDTAQTNPFFGCNAGSNSNLGWYFYVNTAGAALHQVSGDPFPAVVSNTTSDAFVGSGTYVWLRATGKIADGTAANRSVIYNESTSEANNASTQAPETGDAIHDLQIGAFGDGLDAGPDPAEISIKEIIITDRAFTAQEWIDIKAR